MDLFLETPQQQAERMLRQQQRLIEMQMQGAAAQPFAQNVVPAAVPAAVPGCKSAPGPIPYSKIHMRRSSRSTSVVRVVAVWASACAYWR